MFQLYLCQICTKCYDLRCIWKGAAGAMSGGYVTVAVLIQLGLIPCSEVDPLFAGLIRELLRTL